MSDVFISYSRKDKAFVQQLHQALSAQKRDVWIDWEDIPATADWWREIQAGIDAANTVVFIISPESAQSKVCLDEITYAVNSGKRIVPILYQAVPNNSGLHPSVTSHNWVIFEGQDFNTAFTSLTKAMDTDLSHVRSHTRLLTRAREWEQHQRNASYLLAGVDIDDAEAWLGQSSGKDPLPTNLHTDYILASRKAQRTRQQQILIGVSVALVISIGLAILSLFLFQDASAARERVQQLYEDALTREAEVGEAYATSQFFIPRSRIVPNEPINVYQFPDPNSEVLGQITQAVDVSLFGITPDGEFFNVGINGLEGWMWTRDLASRSNSIISVQPNIAIFNPRDNTTDFVRPTPSR